LDYPADWHIHEDNKPEAAPPPSPPNRRDPLRLALRVAVFVVVFYCLQRYLVGPLLSWALLDAYGPLAAEMVSAVFATWLAMRIYEDIPIFSVGLWWNAASLQNLKLGLLGGVGAAALAMAPPLVTGAAHISAVRAPDYLVMFPAALGILIGSAGEELIFRGYAFQILMAACGPWATIIPIGLLFGLLHGGNPGAGALSFINTAAFGVLFGYAFLRSRDLWLPIGLHFGWNLTLPLFGANLSGITIFREITGHELVWRAGALWSGGEYGPEASILTSAALVPLFVYLWKAPVRRQSSPLTDPPGESPICDPSPRLPS
jgi:hypothetical protein